MKSILYIIFILFIVSSSDNVKANNHGFGEESLVKDLLCYQSNNIGNLKNMIWKEQINNVFSGSWKNEDVETKSITKCNIRYDNNQFYIQVWGACLPSDCDWGELASDEAEEGTHKIEFILDQGFVDRTLIFEIIDGKLKLTHQSHYKDNSGKSDVTLIEYLIKS